MVCTPGMPKHNEVVVVDTPLGRATAIVHGDAPLTGATRAALQEAIRKAIEVAPSLRRVEWEGTCEGRPAPQAGGRAAVPIPRPSRGPASSGDES